MRETLEYMDLTIDIRNEHGPFVVIQTNSVGTRSDFKFVEVRSLFVKDLNSLVSVVSYDDVALFVSSNTPREFELSL